MPRANTQVKLEPAEEAVVTKAVLKAGELLDLPARVLAATLGVSEATISRMRRGAYALERGEKPFELGILLVRLFRSLDAIVGGDQTVAKAWMRNENTALQARPIDTITSVTGLVNAVAYLDARRAVV